MDDIERTESVCHNEPTQTFNHSIRKRGWHAYLCMCVFTFSCGVCSITGSRLIQVADLPLSSCPPTSFPAPEEDGGSDREFPRRANQKHGLHVGGQSFIPSFISAEAVATLRRLDHVC